MRLEFKACKSLCAMRVFRINGIDADYCDFGESGDDAPEDAEEYGCGDRRFHVSPATEDVLSRYNITKEEYDTIATKLAKALSFGKCGLCV